MASNLAAIGLALLFVACGGPPKVGPISGTRPGDVAGALEWPIRGALVSPYRPSTRPSHAGLDLAAPPGTTVVAAEAGEVVYAGHIQGFEGVMAIAHAADLTTVYAHLGEIRAAEHAQVRRGEPIANVGDSGYLHYEIRRAKQPIDPAELYATGPSPEGTTVARADVTSEPAADVPIDAKPKPAAKETHEQVAAPAPKRVRDRTEPLPPPPPARLPREEAAAPAVPHPRGALGADLDTSSAATSESASPSGESRDGVPTPLVVGANLFYVPAKLGYAGLGAVTGVFILGVTQNPDLAGRFWTQTTGGDYWVNGEQLSGEEPIHWTGTPAPNP